MNEKPRISNFRLAMIVVMLLGILVAGGLWWWYRSSRIVATDDARVKGTIVTVSAKISGRVEKVLVNEGDKLEAGQVIARLEQEDFAVQVEQAKANLAMAEAKLAMAVAGNRPQQIAQANATVWQTEANLENVRRNSERDEQLYRSGAISVQQRDASKTAKRIAQAQHNAAQEEYSLSAEGSRPEDIQYAQAQVQQARGALRAAELQLVNASIKAPVAGVVALKSVSEGEVIAFGQPLFSISDLADVWIGANIEETYIGRVEVGQPVAFTIDAYPGKEFTGQVMEVGPTSASQLALLSTENTAANFTKVTQRLPIKIKAEAGEYILKPGMSAVINIRVK